MTFKQELAAVLGKLFPNALRSGRRRRVMVNMEKTATISCAGCGKPSVFKWDEDIAARRAGWLLAKIYARVFFAACSAECVPTARQRLKAHEQQMCDRMKDEIDRLPVL